MSHFPLLIPVALWFLVIPVSETSEEFAALAVLPLLLVLAQALILVSAHQQPARSCPFNLQSNSQC